MSAYGNLTKDELFERIEYLIEEYFKCPDKFDNSYAYFKLKGLIEALKEREQWAKNEYSKN